MRLARQRIAAGCAAVGAFVLLGGCSSTPDHTNTLIFGTTTKFALDVSQDPTGAVGVTLGYRRQEAVWMPLLPNTGKKDSREPARCEREADCPKFVGIEGADRDTYSVFASFGSEATGGAGGTTPGAQGGVAIAQYFATGLAARMLAERGGAALVNTNADPLAASITAEERGAILKDRQVRVKSLDAFAEKVSKDGKVDKGLVDEIFKKPALAGETATRDAVLAFAGKPTADLRGFLRENTRALPVDKMKEALQ
jgi:hypothetical protein